MTDDAATHLQPVFMLEMGREKESGDPLEISVLRGSLSSYLTKDKATEVGESLWEMYVGTMGFEYSPILFEVRDSAFSINLSGPTVTISFPWSCGNDDINQVAALIQVISEQLGCSVMFYDQLVPNPLDILGLYTETGSKLAHELKRMLDRACIITKILKPIKMLELSVRTERILRNMDARILAEIVIKTEVDLLKTINFGRKSLTEIRGILQEEKLGFGMEIDLKGFCHAASHVVPQNVRHELDVRSRINDEYFENFIHVLADFISPAFIVKAQAEVKLAPPEIPVDIDAEISVDRVPRPYEIMEKTRNDALRIIGL
jgi:hypothetical protein